MIRWEEQTCRNWDGYSGEVIVATVAQESGDPRKWNWEIPGAGKIKGSRNAGHRTTEIDARRSAETAWQKWLGLTALKPDLMAAAEMSLPTRRPSKRTETNDAREGETAASSSTEAELERVRIRLEAAEASLNREQERGKAADNRANSAEARAADIEASYQDKFERVRQILDEDDAAAT